MADDSPFFTMLPDGRSVVSLSPQYRPAEGDCCIGVRFVGNTPVVAQVLSIGSVPFEPEHLYVAAKVLEEQAKALRAAREVAHSRSVTTDGMPPDGVMAGAAGPGG